MKREEPCVFCGGEQHWSKASCSMSGGKSYVEYTCADCKSIYRITDGHKETWHRSGHPLSYDTPNQSAQEARNGG